MGKRYVAAGLVVCLLIVAGVSFVKFSDDPVSAPPGGQAVKSQDQQVIGGSADKSVKLDKTEKSKVVESKPIKADAQFNALAPHWKETNAVNGNRKLEMRSSMDEKNWGPWLEVEAVGALREDEPHPDRTYAETPLIIDGQYFQYKISLQRDSLESPSPQIYDLKINHIDSRSPTKTVGIADKIKSVFKSDKAYAAQQHPRVISRSEWGSPDPYGQLFKGTDRYWPPSHKPVKQIFIHHTVTGNFQSDPSAAVRAIWDFHANTRGWGDVGYNYLVDSHGNVYQGRLGGDNAVGGHVLDYNRGSLGVALIGCFDGSETCRQLNGGISGPAQPLLSGLTSLLSNKATSFGIDPWGSNVFCDVNNQNCLNLPTITGHRDAGQTSCPGSLTVNLLQNIRNETRGKSAVGWNYSARQMDYDPINLSDGNGSKNVTLRFKNTGTSAWTNSGNKTSLFNMEPPGTHSMFQGSGWLSSNKPALLNEANVPPGGTGSFTFSVKRPNIPPGRYLEAHTLITDNGQTPGAFFSVPMVFGCTIGQADNPRPNGSVIKDIDSGRSYLIEAGKKRYIISQLAAATNGLNLPYAMPVHASEAGLLANGPQIHIKEGTLLKSKESSSIYILDETPGGPERRWVSSSATMTAFGMRADQVKTITQTALSAYAAGPKLMASSLAPDGRLVKGSNGQIHLVEAGARRYITSPAVFHSYGFSPRYVGTISDQRLGQLAGGGSFNLIRSGTVVKTPGAGDVYVTDIDSGSPERRRITSPYAFLAAGYRAEAIVSISGGALNNYAAADTVECYK